MTSGEFRDTFLAYFEGCAAVSSLDWATLFYSTGLPRHPEADFSNSLSVQALELANRLIAFSASNAEALPSDLTVDLSVSRHLFSPSLSPCAALKTGVARLSQNNVNFAII